MLTLGGVARVERGTVEPLAAAPEAPLTGSYFAVVDRPERGVRIAGTGGVYDWDGAAWSRIPAPVTFLALAQHGDGRLIAASALGAVWAYGADRRWVRLTGDADGRVAALAATPDGDVFAGGEDGVRPVGDDRLLPPLAAGRPSAAVAALAADADGALWAGGTDGRLHRLASPDAAAWDTYALPGWQGGAVTVVGTDARGRVWAGGAGGHAAFGTADDGFTTWTPGQGLTAAPLLAIAGDRTGGV